MFEVEPVSEPSSRVSKKHNAWISSHITWGFNSQPLVAVARGDHAEGQRHKDFCKNPERGLMEVCFFSPGLLPVSLCACAFVHRPLSNKCLVSRLDEEHDAWKHIIWAAERLSQSHETIYKPATLHTICTNVKNLLFIFSENP